MEEPNPFMGVPYGRGVQMLLDDPSPQMKRHFNDTYTDEKEEETLRRATLNQTDSFYRSTSAGAASLAALKYRVDNPQVVEEQLPPQTPEEEARVAWARRLAGGVKRGQEFKPLTAKDQIARDKEEYNSILDRLAEYDRMAPASSPLEYAAAFGGAITGSLLTPENLVAWPIKGASVIARMVWGGMQTAAVSVATDPVVQAINIHNEVQKDFDPVRTAVSGAMGAVIGGGLVGAGEVITRPQILRGLWGMAEVDPAVANRPPSTPRVEEPSFARVEPEEITTRPPSEPQPVLGEAPPSPRSAEEEVLRADQTLEQAAAEPRPATPVRPDTNLPGPVQWERTGEAKAGPSAGEDLSALDQMQAEIDAALGKTTPTPAAPEQVTEPANTYIIKDYLGAPSDDAEMTVKVIRREGKIFDLDVKDADGKEAIIKVASGYRDLPPEEVIARTLGSHPQGAEPDITKVRPALTPTMPALAGTVTYSKATPQPSDSAFKSWTPSQNWKDVEGQLPALTSFEPPLPTGKKIASGIIMVEPDGRIWIVKPKDAYGGYEHTFPKGTLEEGLSTQANAIKEVYEESGLKAEITGFLGDFEGTTSTTRYYLGRRASGTPLEHGPESEAVLLAKVEDLDKLLNMPRDKEILAKLKTLLGQEPEAKAPEFIQTGPQKGSNPGGTYKDQYGVSWYTKFIWQTIQKDNENLANKLYDAVGVRVPFTKTVKIDGQPGIASELLPPDFVPLGKLDKALPEYALAIQNIKEDFAVDVWLANWDVIGLSQDNVMVSTKTPGLIYRIDQGGTMKFRAQGGTKPFGPFPAEWDSMRDPQVAPEAAKIFGKMTNEELIKSIDKLAKITPEKIVEIVQKYGPPGGYQTQYKDNLLKRREWLLEKGLELKLDSLPSAGGKTLDMSPEAKKARAKKMGFFVDHVWYHNTSNIYESFDLKKAVSEKAMFISPKKLNAYGHMTLEVWHRAKNVKVVGDPNKPQYYSHTLFKEMINQGHKDGLDAILFKNVVDSGTDLNGVDQLAILKPKLVRKIDAAFDPKKKQVNKLAAMEDPNAPKETENFEKEYEDWLLEAKNDQQFAERYAADPELAAMRGVSPLLGLVPPTEPPRPEAVVQSLQEMSNNLAKTFGEAIRQGGVKKGNLGQYDTTNGVIRVREFPDFPVNAHEVAHAIANKNTGDIHLQGTDQLSRWAQDPLVSPELKLLDYNLDPVDGQRISEGFAEFIRHFLTGPEFLIQNAPQAYSKFVNTMEQHYPEMFADLVGFQQAFAAYKAATPEQLALAKLAWPVDTWGSRIVGMFTDAEVAPTVSNVLHTMYNATVAGVEGTAERFKRAAAHIIAGQEGRRVRFKPDEDPQIRLLQLQKAAQTAMAQLRSGVMDYHTGLHEGPTMEDVLLTAFNQSRFSGFWKPEDFEKFNAYLVSRVMVERWKQREAGKLSRDPSDQSKESYQALVDQYDREYPTFRRASDMFHQIERNYLRREKDSGAILGLDQDSHDEIVKSIDFYARLNRDVKDKRSGTGARDIGSPPIGIKSIHGSMRDIIPPVISLINHMMVSEEQIAFAQMMRGIRSISERMGPFGGQVLEMRPAHEVKKIEFDLEQSFRTAMREAGYSDADAKTKTEAILSNVFGTDDVRGVTFKTVMVDGKRQQLALWADDGKLQAAYVMRAEDVPLKGYDMAFGLYEMLSKAPRPAADVSNQLLRMFSSWLTGSITTHPVYALRNFFRDQIPATGFIPGYIPFYHAITGAIDIARGGPATEAYRKFGGVSAAGGIVPAYADAVEADVRSLVRSGISVRKVLSLRGFAEIVSTGELATRVGATQVLYKQKKRQGLSDMDAWQSAVFEARDLLPFDRFGDKLSSARHVIPFLGSFIQSMDKARRAMPAPVFRFLNDWIHGRDPFALESNKEELAKAAWAIGVFGVGLYGFGKMWGAMMEGNELYERVSDKVKMTNFVVPWDNGVILIPKFWELSLGFTAGELSAANSKKNSPRAWEQYKTAVRETLMSPNLLYGNPLVATSVGLVTNYNLYTGTPIEPERMQGWAGQERYNAQTGLIAKQMGQITGWSPKKIDFMLTSLGGYYGRDLTMLGRGNQDENYVQNLQDMASTRAGIRDPYGVSDAREKYWKLMGKTTGAYSMATETFRALVQDPQRRYRALEFFDRLPESQKAWVTLSEAARPDGKPAFGPDDRRSHPLERAKLASSVLVKMMQDVANNSAVDAESKETLVVNPEIRKIVVNTLGMMAVDEYSNALSILGEFDYAGKPLVDPSARLEVLKTHAPHIAEEIRSRFAKQKVYKTEAVARAYPELKRELIARGGQADIQGLVFDVRLAGYEFEGERRRGRELRKRIEIPGAQR